ncbi:MAG: acetate--CoA ligase family protein, partial [Planctomycetes bacterium]|nr:acetate--CoA ligase family protein [Planctomycetota bacterium]
MNLHEYQAKQILSRTAVPVLPGRLAETPDQAAEAYRALASPVVAVKVQTHAGGRGKGAIYEKDLKTLRVQGGVKIAKSADEARSLAAKMLGGILVSVQTGPQGRLIRKVYVEAGCDIARELYLGCVLDRKLGKPVMIASAEGGVEIEEVAKRNPQAILRQAYDVAYGLRPFQARLLGYGLGLNGDAFKQFAAMATALSKMYVERDCSLLEINPLVVTRQDKVIALDAKMSIDDRAIELKKQPEIAEMRDVAEEDPLEHEAHAAGLSYVSMPGNIGCMVNGAGLAMATMD